MKNYTNKVRKVCTLKKMVWKLKLSSHYQTNKSWTNSRILLSNSNRLWECKENYVIQLGMEGKKNNGLLLVYFIAFLNYSWVHTKFYLFLILVHWKLMLKKIYKNLKRKRKKRHCDTLSCALHGLFSIIKASISAVGDWGSIVWHILSTLRAIVKQWSTDFKE